MVRDYLRALIPKDKFDFSPFPELMEIGEEEVKPILPELFYWVADMNWPIATEMVKVLVRFPDSVIPLIKELLKPTEEDDDWKWFVIVHLIPALPTESQKLLAGSIRRILDAPTDREVYGEVWEVAKNYASGDSSASCP